MMLFCNNIGDAGAQALAERLKSNSTMEYLELIEHQTQATAIKQNQTRANTNTHTSNQARVQHIHVRLNTTIMTSVSTPPLLLAATISCGTSVAWWTKESRLSSLVLKCFHTRMIQARKSRRWNRHQCACRRWKSRKIPLCLFCINQNWFCCG